MATWNLHCFPPAVVILHRAKANGLVEEGPWGAGYEERCAVTHSGSRGSQGTLCLLTTALTGIARLAAKHIRPPLKTATQVTVPGHGSAKSPRLELSSVAVTVG